MHIAGRLMPALALSEPERVTPGGAVIGRTDDAEVVVMSQHVYGVARDKGAGMHHGRAGAQRPGLPAVVARVYAPAVAFGPFFVRKGRPAQVECCHQAPAGQDRQTGAVRVDLPGVGGFIYLHVRIGHQRRRLARLKLTPGARAGQDGAQSHRLNKCSAMHDCFLPNQQVLR